MSETAISPLRLTVGKRRVLGRSGEVEQETHYELEIDVSQAGSTDELNAMREAAEKRVSMWMGITPWQPTPEAKEHALGLAGIPDLDEADLNCLPWWVGKRSTGHEAKDQEEGWIGRDPQYLKEPAHQEILAALEEAIRKSKGSFDFGMFNYKYSGGRQQYITRKVLKQESAK